MIGSVMSVAIIGFIVLGLGALLLYALAEAACDAVFACIGAGVVWLISFGRVRMEPLRAGGESELAAWLGVILTFLIILATSAVVQHFRNV